MRAAFHLLRAGVESLKAIEAVVDELGKVGHRPADGDAVGRDTAIRIEVE
jgi:hypothetical protein